MDDLFDTQYATHDAGRFAHAAFRRPSDDAAGAAATGPRARGHSTASGFSHGDDPLGVSVIEVAPAADESVLMEQVQELRSLWQAEAVTGGTLRQSLDAAQAALTASQTAVAMYAELVRCLTAAQRCQSVESLCVCISEHFYRAFAADRVTLFFLDADTSELWTTINDAGDQFRVPLANGPVSSLLGTCATFNERRGDIISAYMRSMQRDDYAPGEVHSVLSMVLKDEAGGVMGFVEVLNKPTGEFTDADEAMLRTVCLHLSCVAGRIIATALDRQQLQVVTSKAEQLENLAQDSVATIEHLTQVGDQTQRVLEAVTRDSAAVDFGTVHDAQFIMAVQAAARRCFDAQIASFFLIDPQDPTKCWTIDEDQAAVQRTIEPAGGMWAQVLERPGPIRWDQASAHPHFKPSDQYTGIMPNLSVLMGRVVPQDDTVGGVLLLQSDVAFTEHDEVLLHALLSFISTSMRHRARLADIAHFSGAVAALDNVSKAFEVVMRSQTALCKAAADPTAVLDLDAVLLELTQQAIGLCGSQTASLSILQLQAGDPDADPVVIAGQSPIVGAVVLRTLAQASNIIIMPLDPAQPERMMPVRDIKGTPGPFGPQSHYQPYASAPLQRPTGVSAAFRGLSQPQQPQTQAPHVLSLAISTVTADDNPNAAQYWVVIQLVDATDSFSDPIQFIARMWAEHCASAVNIWHSSRESQRLAQECAHATAFMQVAEFQKRLLDVVAQLGCVSSLKALYSAVSEAVCTLVNAQQARLYTYDERSSALWSPADVVTSPSTPPLSALSPRGASSHVPAAGTPGRGTGGAAQSKRVAFSPEATGTRVIPGVGAVGGAYSSGDTVFIGRVVHAQRQDVEEAAETPLSRSLLSSGTPSRRPPALGAPAQVPGSVAVPVKSASGAILAVLEAVDKTGDRDFDTDDRTLLETYATFVCSALQQLRALESAKTEAVNSAEELQRVGNSLDDTRAALGDLKQQLHTAQAAAQATAAKAALDAGRVASDGTETLKAERDASQREAATLRSQVTAMEREIANLRSALASASTPTPPPPHLPPTPTEAFSPTRAASSSPLDAAAAALRRTKSDLSMVPRVELQAAERRIAALEAALQAARQAAPASPASMFGPGTPSASDRRFDSLPSPSPGGAPSSAPTPMAANGAKSPNSRAAAGTPAKPVSHPLASPSTRPPLASPVAGNASVVSIGRPALPPLQTAASPAAAPALTSSSSKAAMLRRAASSGALRLDSSQRTSSLSRMPSFSSPRSATSVSSDLSSDVSIGSGIIGQFHRTVRAVGNVADLDHLFADAMTGIRELVGAERCTLFVYDKASNELWSKVADLSGQLRMPVDRGLAGLCATSKQIVNVPDAYTHPQFNKEYDRQSGYRTRSVLCVPVLDRTGAMVAVIQMLNKTNAKKGQQAFTKADEKLVTKLADHVSNAVEHTLHTHQLDQALISERAKLEAQGAALVAAEASLKAMHAEMTSLQHQRDGSSDTVPNGDAALETAATQAASAAEAKASKALEVAQQMLLEAKLHAAREVERLRDVTTSEAQAIKSAAEQQIAQAAQRAAAAEASLSEARFTAAREIEQARRQAAEEAAQAREEARRDAEAAKDEAARAARQAMAEADRARIAAMEEAATAKARAIEEAAAARAKALEDTAAARQEAATFAISAQRAAEQAESAMRQAEEAKAAQRAALERVAVAIREAEEAKAAAKREATEMSNEAWRQAEAARMAREQALEQANAALRQAEEAKAAAKREAMEQASAAWREADEAKAIARREAQAETSAAWREAEDARAAVFAAEQERQRALATIDEVTRAAEAALAAKSVLEEQLATARRVAEEQVATVSQVAQSRQGRLEQLVNISAQFATAHNIQDLFSGAMMHVRELLNAERATLFLVDGAKGIMWSKVADFTDQITIPIGRGLAGAAAISGAPVNVTDAYNDRRFDDTFDRSSGYQTRTVLCVPVFSVTSSDRDVRREVVAVVQLINRLDGAAFDADDLALVELMTPQIAATVHNCRDFEAVSTQHSHDLEELQSLQSAISEERDAHTSLMRQVYQSKMVVTVAALLAAARDGQSICGVVQSQLAPLLEVERCELFLLDKDKGDLWSAAPGEAGKASEVRIPLGTGLVGSVARNGTPTVLAEASAISARLAPAERRLLSQAANIMAVPLIAQVGGCVGVLILMNKQRASAFDTSDTNVVSVIANHIAIAVGRVDMDTHTRQRLHTALMHLAVTKARLESESKKRDSAAKAQDRWLQVAKTCIQLFETFHFAAAFDVVTRVAHELVPSVHATLYMVDVQENQLWSGLGPDNRRLNCAELHSSPLGRVVASGSMVLSPGNAAARAAATVAIPIKSAQNRDVCALLYCESLDSRVVDVPGGDVETLTLLCQYIRVLLDGCMGQFVKDEALERAQGVLVQATATQRALENNLAISQRFDQVVAFLAPCISFAALFNDIEAQLPDMLDVTSVALHIVDTPTRSLWSGGNVRVPFGASPIGRAADSGRTVKTQIDATSVQLCVPCCTDDESVVAVLEIVGHGDAMHPIETDMMEVVAVAVVAAVHRCNEFADQEQVAAELEKAASRASAAESLNQLLLKLPRAVEPILESNFKPETFPSAVHRLLKEVLDCSEATFSWVDMKTRIIRSAGGEAEIPVSDRSSLAAQAARTGDPVTRHEASGKLSVWASVPRVVSDSDDDDDEGDAESAHVSQGVVRLVFADASQEETHVRLARIMAQFVAPWAHAVHAAEQLRSDMAAKAKAQIAAINQNAETKLAAQVEQEEVLRVRLRACETLSSCDTFDALQSVVKQLLPELLTDVISAATLYLYDDASGVLWAKRASSDASGAESIRIPPGIGPVGEAFSTGRALLGGAATVEASGTSAVRETMCIPVRQQNGEVRAVLEVLYSATRLSAPLPGWIQRALGDCCAYIDHAMQRSLATIHHNDMVAQITAQMQAMQAQTADALTRAQVALEQAAAAEERAAACENLAHHNEADAQMQSAARDQMQATLTQTQGTMSALKSQIHTLERAVNRADAGIAIITGMYRHVLSADVYAKACARLRELFACVAVTFHVVDEESGGLVVKASDGSGASQRVAESGAASRALSSAQLVNICVSGPLGTSRSSPTATNIMAVPCRNARGQLMGVVELVAERADPSTFNEFDERLVTHLAAQFACAYDRRQQERDLKRDQGVIEQLRAEQDAISRQLEARDAACSELNRALHEATTSLARSREDVAAREAQVRAAADALRDAEATLDGQVADMHEREQDNVRLSEELAQKQTEIDQLVAAQEAACKYLLILRHLFSRSAAKVNQGADGNEHGAPPEDEPDDEADPSRVPLADAATMLKHEARSCLSAYAAKIRELRAAERAAQNAAHSAASRATAADLQTSETATELSSLRSQMSRLKHSLAEVTVQLEDSRARRKEQRAIIQSLQEKLAAAQTSTARVQAEFQTLLTTYRALQLRFDKLQALEAAQALRP